MKRLGRLIRQLVLILLIAVIAINMCLLAKRLIRKEELPSLFGYSMVTVLSGSMEPEFSPGDMLIIKEQPDYQVGDVVTRQENGSFITHRIVQKSGDGFLTQGDANNAPDGETVFPSQIYGTVRLIIPKVGNLVLFLKTPLGTLVLVVAFLILAELSGRRGKEEQEEQISG